MAAQPLTKAQLAALGVARSMMRHVKQNLITGEAGKNDVSLWTNYIMQQYRANQRVTDKTRIRQLRMVAADQLRVLQAVKEEQDLFHMYSGIDTNSKEYVQAAAYRVGLELPQLSGAPSVESLEPDMIVEPASKA